MTMPNTDERPAIMLGLTVLFVLAVLTAAVPIVGYVLLGLVILLVVGLLVAFVVAWRCTRWQPLDDQHRPAPVSEPVTQADVREVA